MVRLAAGVRQGCVLSPLLYAIFIDGLIKYIKKKSKKGFVFDGVQIQTLFYADDIVLFAEDRYTLQYLMDLVTRYAKKWRFDINRIKSAVVVFGKKRAPRNIVWRLGDGEPNIAIWE